VLDTNTITATDSVSGGQIQVTSRVHDNFGGDFTKLLFEYDVLNLSYDPASGSTNGLSGYQVSFGGFVPGVADQMAPASWVVNCCGVTPPLGAEADIDNATGFGIAIGNTGSFGYTVPAGTGWTDVFTGSWAHSWQGNSQVGVFDQIDGSSGLSILTPVPEPAAVLLLGAGALMAVSPLRGRPIGRLRR